MAIRSSAVAVPTTGKNAVATTPHAINSSVLSAPFLERTRRVLERQRALYRSPAAARHASDAVFRDLLAEAEGTYFGRKHGLAAVRTRRDWKAAIPVRRYEEFEPYIAKILDGDINVLTRSTPYAVLKTSGSSGRPKLIPTTRHWRDRYRGPALYGQWGLYFEKIGLDQAAGTSVLDLSWARSISSGSADEYRAYCISQRPAAVSSADWLPPWYQESWFAEFEGEDYPAGLYRKLRLLATADVRIIVALNPSKIVGLADVLATRSAELIADVHDGSLAGGPLHHPGDPAAARRLEQSCVASGGALRLSDLWPGLALVVSWNSASAALYRPWLEKVTPGVAKLPFSATGTEGIVTMPIDDHPAAGPLAVDLGLYEFAEDDADDGGDLKPDVATLDYHELEVGRTYRLVMSQANGLCRYDLGDRYHVVDRIGAVPQLDFVGRSGFVSSFTGEKLAEEDVYRAVHLALGERSAPWAMFTCVPVWATPPGYTLAIEWPPGAGTATAGFADRLDAALRELNMEYAEKRNSDRLTPIAVLPVTPGAFRAVEERRRRSGASPAQLKHHWIQRNDDILPYLRDATAPLT